MTRAEMLKQMKLTDEELKDLIHKYKTFYNSLNAHQKAVVTRSLPTLSAAAKSFGPDVTQEDLQKELGLDPTTGSFIGEGMVNFKIK